MYALRARWEEMMTDIKNIVILGDSLSDIGNKWIWPAGELGRLVRAMRVNETGRFSDGMNWTDFLVLWSTGTSLLWGNRDLAIRKSTDHRTLTRYSRLAVEPFNGQVKPKADESAAEKTIEQLIEEVRRIDPTPVLPEITYVNYAMGGCIATRDWTFAPKFGALSYLKGQVDDYLTQRAQLSRPLSGPTLHIIWIGKACRFASMKVKTSSFVRRQTG